MYSKKNKDLISLSDSELIERYRHSHDMKYIGVLYNRYSALVLGLCLKYFKEKASAEDAVMDIFEKIIKELKRHPVQNFKSWLYTLSKNHCFEILRKNKSAKTKKDRFETFLSRHSMENETYLHQLEEDEKEKVLNQLEEALPLLKDKQLLCMKEFYLKGKSYKKLAEETGLTLKEVKSHIQNGKRNLKIQLTGK